MSEDLVVLREILQRELETINAYEKMLERINDASLRQIIAHVTDEEREHVAEMYQLILEHDPQQRLRDERGRAQLADMALLTSPRPAISTSPALLHAPTAAAAAGLGERVLIAAPPAVDAAGREIDPMPSPPPFFPQGAWSVGPLKVRSP